MHAVSLAMISSSFHGRVRAGVVVASAAPACCQIFFHSANSKDPAEAGPLVIKPLMLKAGLS
jgi:hypothetical protein